ncbi:hypothetical protein [Streptomyces wuyuanensis]|uniref:Uncharacterized protein n=1 Tax=Streptomyces wuyuanensis TaxID=1196353 RepID=A0A1H0BLD9_9ACTN|nr:hypothetical protein [Streptomyces wuyuanensis]SDN46355.1 hypothetical protein SAMN05444921_127112 [Streptomyces wuyuanensis]
MQTFNRAKRKTAFAAAALSAVLVGAGAVAGAVGGAGASTDHRAATVADRSHGKPADEARNGNIWGP